MNGGPPPGKRSVGRRTVLLPLLVLGLALVASGAAMAWVGADAARRLLVLHSALAVALLPLAFALQFTLPSRGAETAGRSAIVHAIGIAGAVLALAGLALFAPGRPLLTTWLPSMTGPAFALVQIAAALGVALVLARPLLPGTVRGTPERALAWTTVPIATTLLALAWGWNATDAHAGHVRAELSTWAAGHAAPFVVASLLVWTWTGLAEMDDARRARWCGAAALPVLAVPVFMAFLPADDLRALRAYPELLRWGLWPVPALLAVAILRDDIRRELAGRPFFLSLAAFLPAVVGGFAALSESLATAAMNLRAHALPVALLIGGSALLLRRHARVAGAGAAPGARHSAARLVFAAGSATAVAILVAVLVARGTEPPAAALAERLPAGVAPGRHVEAKRSEEVHIRFAQGVEMMRLRQYEFAVKAFHRVLELDPAIPEAHVNMGFALYETGDPAGAQRFFESATRLDRGQLNAYYGLALAAQAQGNREVAVGAMRAWLHLAPQDDPFRDKAERKLREMLG